MIVKPDFNNFIALDFEFNMDKKTSIVQLSAVKVINNIIVDYFNVFIDGPKLKKEFINLTGITQEEYNMKKINKTNAIKLYKDFSKDFNTFNMGNFDNKALNSNGMLSLFSNMFNFQSYLPNGKSLGLANLAIHNNLDFNKDLQHNALYDAEILAQLINIYASGNIIIPKVKHKKLTNSDIEISLFSNEITRRYKKANIPTIKENIALFEKLAADTLPDYEYLYTLRNLIYKEAYLFCIDMVQNNNFLEYIKQIIHSNDTKNIQIMMLRLNIITKFENKTNRDRDPYIVNIVSNSKYMLYQYAKENMTNRN